MKALLIFSFIAFANPIDVIENKSKCEKIREHLFQALGDPNEFLNQCQLKYMKSCKNNPECFDRTTFKCLEVFWELRLNALKDFNKYKCYRKISSS